MCAESVGAHPVQDGVGAKMQLLLSPALHLLVKVGKPVNEKLRLRLALPLQDNRSGAQKRRQPADQRPGGGSVRRAVVQTIHPLLDKDVKSFISRATRIKDGGDQRAEQHDPQQIRGKGPDRG